MKKGLTVKMQLLMISLLPVLIIGITLLIIGSKTLEKKLFDEAMQGLLSAAKLYREEILTTGRDLSTAQRKRARQWKS